MERTTNTSIDNRTSEAPPKRIYPTYPKPMQVRDISRRIDVNGFTTLEKATLRGAWRIIEPCYRRYGKETFHDFLTINEHLIGSFRFGGKISMTTLHGHALAMMKMLAKLIYTTDQTMEFRSTLEEHMPVHVQNSIDSEYMVVLARCIKDYLLDIPVLRKNVSATLVNALDRLMAIIGEYNFVEQMRKQTQSAMYLAAQVSHDTQRSANTLRTPSLQANSGNVSKRPTFMT